MLGKDLRREALAVDPDFQKADVLFNTAYSKDVQWYFPETGHNLRFRFLEYWQQNGGLDRFGYPISEEHKEVDPETGNVFVMQWFERARFEYHTENQRPYDVLLGLLGNQIKNPKSKIEFMWKYGEKDYNSLNKPKGIAVDQADNIFITDRLSNRVVKFNSEGKTLARWWRAGINDGEFQNPIDITLDLNGNIYVLDSGNKRVQKFDSNGQYLDKYGQGKEGLTFSNPTGLAIDKLNQLYVADTENYLIYKFDAKGRFVSSWGGYGTTEDKFNSPISHIALDSNLNVYVISGFIKKYSNSGTYLKTWDRFNSGDGRPIDVDSIHIDKNDLVLIGAKGKIVKYDVNGNFLGSIIRTDSSYTATSSIVTDTKSNIIITDEERGYIAKYSKDGIFLVQWGGDNQDLLPTSFTSYYNFTPVGLAIDQKDSLYISDAKSNQIIVFNSSFNQKNTWLKFDHPLDFVPGPLAYDQRGYIYVINRVDDTVNKFDINGHLLLKWGGRGIGKGQISFGSAIAIDSEGLIYVSDWSNSRIVKFNSSGEYVTNWLTIWPTVSGSTIAYNPTSISIDKYDNVYTTGRGIGKYDKSGNLLKWWDDWTPTSPGLSGLNLATDKQSNLYLFDETCIKKYDPDGNLLFKWNSIGEVDGQLASNLSFSSSGVIAVDSQGNIYISEQENNRIQKFRQR